MHLFFNQLKLTLSAPEPKTSPPLIDWLLLGFLALIVVYAENLGFSYQPLISSGDSAISMIQESLKFFLLLKHSPDKLYLGFSEYPPLVFFLTSAFYGVSGFSAQLAALSSLLFFLVLILALYQSGYLLGGRLCGWLAVFLVLMNPRTLFWSKFYTLNLPEAACLALALAFLQLSREFHKPAYSWLFGAALGLGLLTKYMGIVILIPLILTGITIIRREFPTTKKQLQVWGVHGLILLLGLGIFWGFAAYRLDQPFRHYFRLWQILGIILAGTLIYRMVKTNESNPTNNFAGSLLIAAALALPWYLSNLGAILGLMQTHPQMYSSTHSSMESPMKIFLLYAGHLFPAAPWFLAGGIIFCLLNFKGRYQLLLLSTLGGFLLLSWLGIGSDYRYFLTLIPWLILLAVSWVKVLPKLIQAALVFLSLLWFVLNLEALVLNYHYLAPNSCQTNFSRAILDFSRIPPPLADPKKNYPNLNLKDLVLMGLEPPELRVLARKIAQTLPPQKTETLTMVFLNPVNRLVVENAQLETFLWAEHCFPGGSFAAEKLNHPWVKILEFRKPFPLIEFPAPHRQRLEDFTAYRFRDKPQYLLIASEKPGELKILETRARQAGFNPRLLTEFHLFRRNWEKYTDFYLKCYRV